MFEGVTDGKIGLRKIIEDQSIVKLIHDIRSDWDSLLYQYEVTVNNYIDTQEAFFVFKLFINREITLPISLSKFIESFTNDRLTYKEQFKHKMHEDNQIWIKRPLNEDQLQYAAQDVYYLLKAWENLVEFLNDNLIKLVSE